VMYAAMCAMGVVERADGKPLLKNK